ncbi:MAG: hypothetical protein N3G79_05405 [Sulfolobales archaeon]|nr:hypothetical protein [Sulfolobales archaeon]
MSSKSRYCVAGAEALTRKYSGSRIDREEGVSVGDCASIVVCRACFTH